MKVLLSPAKSLNYQDTVPTDLFTIPQLLEDSKEVNEVTKNLSVADLKDLMHISDALANLNFERNQARTYDFKNPSKEVRQAVYAFNGDVYTGLDAYTIVAEKLDFMQNHLYHLSGLYGILRPLDLMEPYRLEMGIKLDVNGSKDLYGFWKQKITHLLNEQLSENDVLVNLASKEYFSAVDKKRINAKIISPEFKEFKNDKLKIISFFAKKARGLMARYIIDNEIKDVERLKEFTVDGYRYDENLSTATEWIFTR